MTLEEIASRLRARPDIPNITINRQKVSYWIRDPRLMPMCVFAALNRILEIEAEEARKVAVVWR